MIVNGIKARNNYNDIVVDINELRDSNGNKRVPTNVACIAVEDEDKGSKWVGFVSLVVNKRGQVILEVSSNRDDVPVRHKVLMDKLPLNPLLIPDEGGGGYKPKAKKSLDQASYIKGYNDGASDTLT